MTYLTRLRVVGAPVDMPQHVHVGRDPSQEGGGLLRGLQVSLQHLVHEVDVPEVVAGPAVVLYLEGHLADLPHHVLPVVVADRHDHLVDVCKRLAFVRGLIPSYIHFVVVRRIFAEGQTRLTKNHRS